MPDKFISEAIKPDPASFDTQYMSAGAPGLPREFLWGNEKVKVKNVLNVWRTTGPCHHGSKEQYVRRHWFEVATESHGTMKIYFDKGTNGKRREMGWFIYSVAV